MDRPSYGGAYTRQFIPLLLIEGSPFGALVDECGRENETALFTNKFTRVVVPQQIRAAALGADHLAPQCRCQVTTPKT